MANNRGGIPMYNENPQYSATISSQLPQGSPASFGTQVAKEMAGMGDAIGKWGTNLVEFALKQQEKADDNYVMRRENEMRRALNELMYNPQTGLTNQKLHNAQGVTMAFDDEVEKLTQQFMSDVNNPNLQAKFQQRIGQWIPGYRTTVAKHEGDETFTARKVDIDTGIQDEIDSALRTSSADSAKILYNALWNRMGDLQDVLGMSREAAAEYVQEKYSAGILQMVTELSKTSDTYNLMGVYDAVKDKVTGEVRAKIGALAGVAKLQDEAYREVEVYLKDPSFYVNGVLQPDLVRKAYQEDHNEYENVFVPDGSGADLSNFSEREIEVWGAAQFASQRIKEKRGIDIPPDWIYRQWAKESTYQGVRFNSPLARENNNFGGLTQTTPNGEANKQPDGNNYYREYGSLQDYARSYVDDFILLYDGLENVNSLESYSHFLKSNGYYGADEGEYTASLVNMTDVPSVGGHYEKRRKYNQVKEDAFMAEVMRRAKSSEASAKQAISGYINQLLADPDIKNVRDPAVLREKMERLGVPQYWQKDVLNGVSFEVGINNQSVSYQRGEKAYNQQQAADAAYNWYSNKILSGETVTKSEFAQQDFAGGLSGHNKATFLNMIDNEEKAAAKNMPNWFKGQTLSTFNSACAEHDVKGDLRGNAIDSVNQLQQEIWEKEHRPLTNHEIIERVRDISMTKEMDDGWGPFNWGATKYKVVEDPEVTTNENGEKVVVGLEDE